MKIPTVKFVFDRRKQASAKKKGSVELRVTYDRKQKFMSTGVFVFPKQWDEKNESVKGSMDAPLHNEILQSIRQRVLTIITEMVTAGAIDLAGITARLHVAEIPITFLQYIERRIEEKEVRPATRKRYVSFLHFMSSWHGIVTFSQITEANIRKMGEFLHKRIVKGEKMKQSTIYGYHKHLKQFINDAVVDGYLESNPYVTKRIRIDRGVQDHIESLTEKQIKDIRAINFPEGYMTKTRDLFVFQCYTGLAYIDLMAFDISRFKKMEDGTWFGVSRRVKTNSEFALVLLPPAIEILKKYGWKVPRISNQKYNMYLKVLGAAINVPNLHSHMGRSSFASLMLNHGVSLDLLQKMVGHKVRSMTQRYATMRDDTIRAEFDKVRAKLD